MEGSTGSPSVGLRLAPGRDMVSAEVALMRASFEEAAHAGTDVTLDLDGVRDMDGSGVGAIAHMDRSLAAAGLRLRVVNASGQPLALLGDLGLLRLFGHPDGRG